MEVEAPAAAVEDGQVRPSVHGSAGTPLGLCLRLLQLGLAVAGLAVMIRANFFRAGLWGLALVAILQCVWCLPAALLYCCSMLAKCTDRCLLTCFIYADMAVVSAMVTAALKSSLVHTDCAKFHCASYWTALWLTCASVFAMVASFLLNYAALDRGYGGPGRPDPLPMPVTCPVCCC
ncbi:hypothetical protein EJB05_24953, partial [Eragrostis curvula]